MKSFYGELGTPACRFHEVEVANGHGHGVPPAMVEALVEASCFEVLYGDTDSVFVRSGLSATEARIAGPTLTQDINAAIAEYIDGKWPALDNAGLSVRRAAEATGFAAADFSRIRNANLRRFTVDRLVRMLSALDRVSETAALIRGSSVLSELGQRHDGPRLTDTDRGDTQSTPSLDSFDAVALAKRYERNPALRALVKLIPYGSAVEAAALAAVGRIRVDRARTFFDELATANAIDNPELLESEDFIHRFLTTMTFALNTRRREKIQMFARLFGGSLPEGELSDVDEYEDFLVILDELSYRELRALAILRTFADTPRAEKQNDMQWTMTFWDDFCARLRDELPLSAEEVPDYMKRISRTGCFQELVGYYDARPGVGKLTPTYLRLAAYVRAVG